ncbi:MAG: 30S ribosomal protein S13 [Parcubacteria group bacterium]|nr:30S ribosomal protein S13 [Parcubacteria group bacterium]
MPRIAGINIPENKNIQTSLTYIYGVGLTLSKKILLSANIPLNRRAKDLTSEEINKIQNIIEKSYPIEGNLRRQIADNIRRLKDAGSWRGSRHARKLPIRGRTKTNSRTLRGNLRKTMGSGRRPATSPT